MIIYLCMKYESNTPMYSKDIAWKPFFVCTGQDVRDVRTYGCTDKGDAKSPPHYKWWGHYKGTDQSVHPASLMGDFVICSLESIIAKQLNLVHSKLQASIEQADFSKMLSVILKKHVAEHIEPAHYPNRTVTFQAKEGTFVLHVHNC